LAPSGAALAALLIFGGGVRVGAEFGDSDGHHHRSGTSYAEGGGDYRPAMTGSKPRCRAVVANRDFIRESMQ
jgi:hypothetical protein